MSYANPLEIYMLDLVNQERTSRGLNALELETNLNSSAEIHSDWMLDTNIFSHTGEGNSSATNRMEAAGFDLTGAWGTAENLAVQSARGAAGYEDDVLDLHNSLMNSPGHRANILTPSLEYIGIGIEVGDFTYDGGQTAFSVIATQNFAYTQGTVDLDTLTGGPEETYVGTIYADAFTGTDANDLISGLAGADSLHGGGGNDEISGGTGADRLYGDDGDDLLEGDSSTDSLYGGAGRDEMHGGTGADTLYGNSDADSLFGNTGVDLVYGGSGDDFVSSGNGVDTVYGGHGDDHIIGRTGNDVLNGGDDDDSIFGSEGEDVLNGDGGSDFLSGGSGFDILSGGSGNDSLYGNLGSDELSGDDGNDRLYGATGNDSLFGGAGDDLMYGSQGVDLIDGGSGNDTMFGGSLVDTFVFAAGHGADEIGDFEAAHDVLQLSSALVGSASTGQEVLDAYGTETADGVSLNFGGGNTIDITLYLGLGSIEDNIVIA